MKKASYLFLIFLGFILFFIVGTRWGQRVEKTNKVIDYILNIPTATPVPIKPLDFATYQNKLCGVRFIYPMLYTPYDESSTSAKFKEGEMLVFRFDCRENGDLEKILKENDQNPTNFLFQKKRYPAKIVGKTYIFMIKNQKETPVYFGVNQSFLPLLEKSLEF